MYDLSERKKKPESADFLIRRLKREIEPELTSLLRKQAESEHSDTASKEARLKDLIRDYLQSIRIGDNSIVVQVSRQYGCNPALLFKLLKEQEKIISNYGWHILYTTRNECVIAPNYTDKVQIVTPGKLFHVTHLRNVNRVLKQGLIPKSGTDKGQHAQRKYPDRVYLTQTFELAKQLQFTFSEADDEQYDDIDDDSMTYVILDVDTTKLDKGTKFFRDIEIDTDQPAVWTYSRIPSGALSVNSTCVNMVREFFTETALRCLVSTLLTELYSDV